MDDLVRRLRACEYMAMPENKVDYRTMDKAADRIEELTTKLAEVEAERDAITADRNIVMNNAEAYFARAQTAYQQGFADGIERAAVVAYSHDYEVGPYSETTIASVVADAIRDLRPDTGHGAKWAQQWIQDEIKKQRRKNEK